ncbi:MAG: hypothetical protein WC635_16540 [Bacteriovorax sp.]|jgi:hypothetical protein
MKKLITITLFLICNSVFANLYLETSYQEGKKPVIVTKQHIFLNQKYLVKYSKKHYVLILKKINGDEATIESENYDIDNFGHKTMHGGSYGTYKVGKSFTITDRSQSGAALFTLKILLEKIVPSKP